MYTDKCVSAVNLNKEYSPSWNTKRFQNDAKPHDRVLEQFIKTTSQETQRVREKYQIKENIRYGGNNDNQLLDIYFKEKEIETPIFVYIHGGFWQQLDKSTSGSFVELFVERNYRVINVDYNLCPFVSLQVLCEQMWNFYNWLYEYARDTKTSSLTICGHSAGAHLSSLLFLERFLNLNQKYFINISFLLISGIYDLRELWNLDCTNPNNILSLSDDMAVKLSPLCWKLNDDVLNFHREHKTNIYIVVAENDSITFKGQSRALAEKLKQLNLNVHLKIFENYDHFDIIEECALHDAPISKYIYENLI